MLEFLKKPHVLYIGNTAKNFGGSLREEAVGRCIQHMINWVDLTHSVIQAELLDFEVLSNLRCFNLLTPG